MALTQILFDEKEEGIIQRFSLLWKSNKPNTIKKMVQEFEQIEEVEDGSV